MKTIFAIATIIDIIAIILTTSFLILNHCAYVPFILLDGAMVWALVETIKGLVKEFC